MSRPILVSALIAILLSLIGLGFAHPLGWKATGDLIASHEAKVNEKGKLKAGKISEAWRGTWQASVAYRDSDTGSVMETDTSTASICPGEPILPDSLMKMSECSTLTNDHEISTMCGAIHLPMPGCVVLITTALDSRRNGEVWSGNGSWRARVFGFCARPKPKRSCAHCDQNTFGEDFVVAGKRVSNQANCQTVTRPSLLESFFAHSELTPILGGKE